MVLLAPGFGSEVISLAEHVLAIGMLIYFLSLVHKRGLVPLVKDFLADVVAGATAMPGVAGIVEGEVKKELDKIEDKMLGDGDAEANIVLPSKGRPVAEVMKIAQKLKQHEDAELETGKKWGGIYHSLTHEGNELMKLQADVWGIYNSTNSLYPGVFPSVRKFEAELVSMCLHLLHGSHVKDWSTVSGQGLYGTGNGKGNGAVGLLSSGGTESILIALKGYRDLARKRGISKPELVCCITAHPAVDKACHYFGIVLVKVPTDPDTQQMDVEATRKAVNSNTIIVYASAPTFPHGVVDPVEELAAITKPRGIGLHVDNCLGGFYLSFLEREGKFDRPWDFQVEGVTSISIDIHKYGLASKGVSVIAFADPKLRSITYCPVMGGPQIYITPTLQGARSGAVMASAWATMLHMGYDGYAKSILRIHAAFDRMAGEVPKLGGGSTLRRLCVSDLAILPIAAEPNAKGFNGRKLDIYVLASLLEKRGWNMFTSRNPANMALCFGEQHTDAVLDAWIKDCNECIDHMRKTPNIPLEGDAAVYGAAETIPANVLEQVMRGYIDVKMSVKAKTH